MKLQHLFESEFDNASHKSNSQHIHTINNKIHSLKKEFDLLNKQRQALYIDIKSYLVSKNLNVSTIVSNEYISGYDDIPEVVEYNKQKKIILNKLKNINNKITELERDLIPLKYKGVEDTKIDSIIGIPNPPNLSTYKGGPPILPNPYFYQKPTHKFAGKPYNFSSNWLNFTQEERYNICVELLNRHNLPNIDRIYASYNYNTKNIEFVMIGNNGNFVWSVYRPQTSTYESNVYINGFKIESRQFFLSNDINKIDLIFTNYITK
jgi:hypothetical protein